MLWTATSCLISFVNSLIWVGNINNPAPVWCDICEFLRSHNDPFGVDNPKPASKLILGVSIGIPAATLCISRRLYYLTAGNTVSITREDVRNTLIPQLKI